MTTAQDVIASDALLCAIEDAKEQAAYASSGNLWEHDFLSFLVSAPDSVRLELAALLNPWRPIETAPKDGTWIIACGPSGIWAKISWGRNRHGDMAWCSPTFWWQEEEKKFSHWQLLPAPPSEDKT